MTSCPACMCNRTARVQNVVHEARVASHYSYSSVCARAGRGAADKIMLRMNTQLERVTRCLCPSIASGAAKHQYRISNARLLWVSMWVAGGGGQHGSFAATVGIWAAWQLGQKFKRFISASLHSSRIRIWEGVCEASSAACVSVRSDKTNTINTNEP